MADWQPISDYSRTTVGPTLAKATATPKTAASAPPGKTTYYNRDSISVTSTRFTVQNSMYPIRNISSVRTAVIPPDRQAVKILIVIWLVLFFLMASNNLWTMAIVTSCAFAVGGVMALVKNKTAYAVKIQAGGGESLAYQTEERTVVEDVVSALNKAVINYDKR